ncbi:23S rRNA (adenine(1618)-N(6))-methyltransferase RlmF [Thalassotalea sp. ND16A]|uniref:23S rRNA (adenine(1618)-N(6))-methyltransferase RlmF n=1 Tax=Thalassotalea sp. ND16A TaxID=1535422 RepID=UPI00051D8330|nr:23S rRNA (adenine(1618)-N(6))-methyltransferase RlmF [Thalassotalea sp. ND16A]KGJ89469.1 rRNA (adenine-N(6)-)-methyltransferase [Thalassotalea sp. ND16A]
MAENNPHNVLKPQLHPRNRHNHGYDLVALVRTHPPLKAFVTTNQYQNLSIDFANSDAVKALNLALLKHHYQIQHWDIPDGYLCPPIPGRVDYLHYLADLLKQSNGNKIPRPGKVRVLDIGTGASCIYPILAQRCYQWQFVASDIDPVSIKFANENLSHNSGLSENIECRLQGDPTHTFQGIIKANEYFALTLCNPPFHASMNDATKGSQQKWQNLNKHKSNAIKSESKLNFGGQNAELWCDGGELKFVRKMITESKHYQTQVLWFTSLLSKKDNIKPLKLALKKAGVADIKVVKMAQGQKISRFIAWSFLNPEQKAHWVNERF